MKSFVDKDLGQIVVKENKRAKRVIVRRKHNAVEMTVPIHLTNREIKEHFRSLKPQIIALPVKEVAKITEHSKISTFTFDVQIKRTSSTSDKVGMNLKDKTLTISIPSHFSVQDENVQRVIKELIIHALRHEAQRVLPQKVALFAKKWNLEYREVKINNSKKRWGSCSSQKNINLSLFLMMLPEHLIDYVILHELAHTIELNHSPRFWNILDKLCDGKAEALNNESSTWDTPYIYSLKQ